MKRIEMSNKIIFIYDELRRTPTHGFLLSQMRRKKHDLGCTSKRKDRYSMSSFALQTNNHWHSRLS